MATVSKPRRKAAYSYQTKLLIDGKFRDSARGKTFATGNPATEEVIAQVAEGEAADETFGPVMQVLRSKNLDEVIERGNTTDYGLAAAVWTCDIAKVHTIANRVRAGTVWVNCYDVFDAAAPFGGFKISGIGRELGKKALENYTEHKTITVSLG